jgi:hypothetical protein
MSWQLTAKNVGKNEKQTTGQLRQSSGRRTTRPKKKKQGNPRLRESQPPQYPGFRGFIRDVRATGEKDDLDKIIEEMPAVSEEKDDLDKIIEEMPAVSESQRKARISLVEKNRTLRKEIEVL